MLPGVALKDGSASTDLSSGDEKRLLLPHLVPPSEEEAVTFYRGLLSQPRLIGRASAGIVPFHTPTEQYEAWRRDPSRGSWFSVDENTTTHIGRHRICSVWDSIEGSVRQCLNELPWSSIDIVRLGLMSLPHADRPVTVWIGIARADIPWATVAGALRECRRILDSDGLDDVDVQMRVSNIVSLVSPPGPRPYNVHKLMRPFDNWVGNAISPFSHPTAFGSLGVSVSPVADRDSASRPVWAITCRHVAIPRSLDRGWPIHRDIDVNEEPHRIVMPSDVVAEKTVNNIRRARDALASSESANSARLAMAGEALARAIGLRDREARAAGSVLFSPPISTATTPSTISSTNFQWTKDYSVIELDRTKFAVDETINTIDAEDLWASAIWCQDDLIEALELGHPGMIVPDTGLIKIRGVIPLDELKARRGSRGSFENSKGDACLVVMKKGSSPNITFGCPSELQSTVRDRQPDGSQIVTREWAIPGSLSDKRMPFSKGGDSGAAIVGLDGRLGGFLTRGAGAERGLSVDITYATPAVLVLADIERELDVAVELL